jgi:hypothetical protein
MSSFLIDAHGGFRSKEGLVWGALPMEDRLWRYMAGRGHSAGSPCDICPETSSFVLAGKEDEVKGWAGGLVLTRLGWSSGGSLFLQIYLDKGKALDRLFPH